jgi:ankyrin repeat protein
LINEECGVYCPDDRFAYKVHRVNIAELLINNICGVYDLDDAGQSALHAACKLCDPGIVKLLLKNKLDVDQRDKMGETPIDIYITFIFY